MKILHLTHSPNPSEPNWFKDHFNYICGQLGHATETLILSDYDSTATKANDFWNQYKDFFNQFDAVHISHIANSCRGFLQNNWDKPIYIQFLFRFDYGVHDKDAYYTLLKDVRNRPNVKFFAGTESDKRYAQSKLGRDFALEVVPPLIYINNEGKQKINIGDRFFLPHKQNEIVLAEKLYGLPIYKQNWETGPPDLRGIRGIVHFPYVCMTRSLLENLALENVYFLPSQTFFKQLLGTNGYFWDSHLEVETNNWDHTWWYSKDLQDCFIFYHSFQHLKNLIDQPESLNGWIQERKAAIQIFTQKHNKEAILKWEGIFND